MTINNTRPDSDAPAAEAIPGLTAWCDEQSSWVQEALRGLADLLNNVPPTRRESDPFASFVQTHMGVSRHGLVSESRDLSRIRCVMVGLAVGELIEAHQPAISALRASGDGSPRWATVDVGPDTHHFPAELALHSDSVIPGVDVVVAIRPPGTFGDGGGSVTVYVRPEHREHALVLLERILARAAELHIFRGRMLQAGYDQHSLQFTVVPAPTGTRNDIIAPADIWTEIDLSIAAVSTQAAQMNALGLAVRRGVLLSGPPGVGKSAICQVIAAELVGRFTVVTCDARTAQHALRAVFDECVQIGPAVVIIDDVDLIVGNRRTGSPLALSEFLAALDSHATERLLVLATTNDVTTLDAAAVRAARFDSVIEVGYPPAGAARQILCALLRDVDGVDRVDLEVVVAGMPANSTGADLREVVRRSVLAGHGVVSTAGLLTQISSGRYRPTMPATGTYL